MKPCSKCLTIKQPTEFYKDKGTSSGLRSQCKTCDNAKSNTWRKANQDKNSKNSVNSQRRNPTRVKQAKLSQYGITQADWDEMFRNQGGVCAICRKPETKFDKRHLKLRKLCVDHCHRTGKVRGLLCGKCNSAIGLLNDDPALFEAGSAYLKS